MDKTTQDLFKLFACPKCGGTLSVKEGRIDCIGCQSTYYKKGQAWDFRTVLEDKDKHWDAEVFDRAYRETDACFEDGMLHALRSGIPRFAEEYRQSQKERLLKDFVQSKKANRLLDLGCGNGWFCYELAELSPGTRFYGIDISTFRIDMFKRHIEESGSQDRMEAASANGENLPFPDNSFDLVVMREVLEHLQEPAKTFLEIHRILIPGGYLLITTPTKLMTEFWKFMAIIPAFVKRLLKKEPLLKKTMTVYDSPLSHAYFKKIIKDSGFEIEEWKRVIFLPHESYLQFIPQRLLRIMVKAAILIKKIPILHFLGLHYVVFLKKTGK